MSFSAASYNVLADAYVEPERYPGVPPELLTPGHRRPAVVHRVAGLGADVLCLQEVERNVFADLTEHLRLRGYEGYFARKSGGKADGCATFVRSGVFAVRAEYALHYADRGDGDLSTGYLALILLLEGDGHCLYLANTHLKWDPPGTPLAERLGYRQITELLRARDQIDPHCPAWVLCGDLNVTPDSETVRAIEWAGFHDSYRDRDGANTFSRAGEAKRIDYLFHTDALRCRPTDLPPLDAGTPLPSAGEPSDHLPILARFDWAGST